MVSWDQNSFCWLQTYIMRITVLAKFVVFLWLLKRLSSRIPSRYFHIKELPSGVWQFSRPTTLWSAAFPCSQTCIRSKYRILSGGFLQCRSQLYSYWKVRLACGPIANSCRRLLPPAEVDFSPLGKLTLFPDMIWFSRLKINTVFF